VITKPIHASQRIIKQTNDGIVVNVFVQINFELERLILGFGDSIQVLKPQKLRNRMLKKLKASVSNYEATSK
jgi:predicted DNA-binding transcriptional regulator YafY